jgi:hypothetical protein
MKTPARVHQLHGRFPSVDNRASTGGATQFPLHCPLARNCFFPHTCDISTASSLLPWQPRLKLVELLWASATVIRPEMTHLFMAGCGLVRAARHRTRGAEGRQGREGRFCSAHARKQIANFAWNEMIHRLPGMRLPSMLRKLHLH